MKNPVKFLLCALVLIQSCALPAQNKEVLVFHKTDGFHHEAIPEGYRAIEKLGKENQFNVTETADASKFQGDQLHTYDLIVFLNTTENVLNEDQQEVFKNYIESGGNFFGIHSATDTEYDWEWYGDLVGAYFDGHPPVQEANIIVEKPEHPTVSHLPAVWTRTDEWYNYKDIHPDIFVLLRLDEDSYEGGTNGEFHPLAWYRHLEEGGVSIYTGVGHTKESYSEPLFLEHIRRCILFALGDISK